MNQPKLVELVNSDRALRLLHGKLTSLWMKTHPAPIARDGSTREELYDLDGVKDWFEIVIDGKMKGRV